MMSMHFEVSSSVTLLFDFWKVHGPGGMVLSVFVVLLFTVVYELLKVCKIWLSEKSRPAPPSPEPLGSTAALESNGSEISLAPIVSHVSPVNRWLLHSLQTVLHVVQVTLGYMLMLCVMSYNVWIFLGVIVGSCLGYFLGFPLLRQYS